MDEDYRKAAIELSKVLGIERAIIALVEAGFSPETSGKLARGSYHKPVSKITGRFIQYLLRDARRFKAAR